MILHGDCLDEMRKMGDNSIDFICCDPPYALNFMGKDWDNEIPTIEVWKEALRICKPGAWLAAFGGTRTFHRLTCCIEDAGWKIRDCICWLYGSGFPKGKGNLKPAWEPIVLARKHAPNPQLNIDECRVNTIPRTTHKDGNYKGRSKGLYELGLKSEHFSSQPQGRWPANLILDEEAGEMLDQMSGILFSGKPGIRKKPHQTNSMSGTLNLTGKTESGHGDSGGASRFFYCAKASSRERNEGLENPSTHPTVKPLSLMRYLIKLLAPPGDPLMLDPFVGSGSSCIAALQLGIRSIGIEKNEEYCEIARKRLEYHAQRNKEDQIKEQRCHQETFDFRENGCQERQEDG